MFQQDIERKIMIIRVQIRCITIAKCNLIFHYCNAKDISFYYFHDATLCANLTNEFHLYCWYHICNINEFCLVYCFHCKFRISSQIMVRDYCIWKCKWFFVYSRLLMPHLAIFLWFKILTLILTLIMLEHLWNSEK